jgi:beta-glucanase (GH16 family)
LEARKFVTGNTTSYTSAKIVSRGKADFGVITNELKPSNSATTTALEIGRRFESRMKLPWGRGIWPAFWMLPTDSTYGSWPKVCNVEFLHMQIFPCYHDN